MIERKDYFEYTPSILRALVDVDGKTGRSRVLQDIYARTAAGTKATFLRGDILNLSPQAVQIRPIFTSDDDAQAKTAAAASNNSNNNIVKMVPYDYCIIATGTAYNSPIRDSSSKEWTRSERENMVNEWAMKLQKADEIVIVGGGIVGVELAGDIIYKYPKKTVRLISKNHALLPELPSKCGQYASEWLQRHGVSLEMGKTLSDKEMAAIITKATDEQREGKGKKGKEKVVLLSCVGPKPTSYIYGNNFQRQEQQQQQHQQQHQEGSSSSATTSNVAATSSGTPIRPKKPLRVNNKLNVISSVTVPARRSSYSSSSNDDNNTDEDESSSDVSSPRWQRGLAVPNVFAIGDISRNPMKGMKTAYTADIDAAYVAKAILQDISRKNSLDTAAAAVAATTTASTTSSRTALIDEYPAPITGVGSLPRLSAVSLGFRDGVLVFNDWILTGMIVSFVKWSVQVLKVAQMNGNSFADFTWNIVESLTFILHRMDMWRKNMVFILREALKGICTVVTHRATEKNHVAAPRATSPAACRS